MVDDADVSLLAPKLVSAPSFDTSFDAPAHGSGVRLSSLPRAVLESESVSADLVLEIGPQFVGPVALATHEQLVAAGHVADGSIEVWRGTSHHLALVAEVEPPAPFGAVVSLCWYRNEWHLFTRSDAGRSSHLVSTDLREWTPLLQLAHSFPAFAVSGVAVRNGEMLLAGRIFVDNTAFGWGLLRSDGRSFEARPVPLPLATQLGVIGPTVNRHGDAVLLLDSGHNRTVARSTGLGWTLSLLIPAVTPTAAFADGIDLWLVGHDDVGQLPALARVNVDGITSLPPSSHGAVRAAIVHGDRLVLAREC
jgi:hypothetical protein